MAKAAGSNINEVFMSKDSFNKINENEVMIFTDGSRTTLSSSSELSDTSVSNPGCLPRAGCGVVIPTEGVSFPFKLNNYTSSFGAEIYAIHKAIEIAIDRGWKKINICTDSESSMSALESCIEGRCNSHRRFLDPSVMDLYGLIVKTMKDGLLSIRFTWCPAHVGLHGNERADALAKEGSENGIVANNKVSFKHCIECMRPKYKLLDSNHFEKISPDTGNYYVNNFRGITLNSLKKFKKKNLKSSMTRIIAGYPFTNSRKLKLGLAVSADCGCGHKDQDMNHIFWSCPIFNTDRDKLLHGLRKYGLMDPFSLEYVINNMNSNKKILNPLKNFVYEVIRIFSQ